MNVNFCFKRGGCRLKNATSHFRKISEILEGVKVDVAKLIFSVVKADADCENAMAWLTSRYASNCSIVQLLFKPFWSQGFKKFLLATGFRKLIKVTNEHLRSLKDIDHPTVRKDSIFVFRNSGKKDLESGKQR